MKLTDALASILKVYKINHVFGLQGGAVVHIFDSLENQKIGITYTHHEQAAALAAVAYAKATENVGCVVVTTGPGSTNAITGLLAAWQDSVPCLFISGQARSQHTSYGRKVRQVGTQEVNICDIVRPITKYTTFIKDKDQFIPELERSLAIATQGRPGPVWMDIPLDLQWSDISPSTTPGGPDLTTGYCCPAPNYDAFAQSIDVLKIGAKPLLVLGYGIRLAGCVGLIREVVRRYEIPFVTTWTAADIFPTYHPLNLGIIGMSGQRGANKAVFSADVILCLGTHMSIPHTTTLFDSYAPQAKKIIVNIDENQLDNLNVSFDYKIHANIKDYLDWLLQQRFRGLKWPDCQVYKVENWYEPTSGLRPNSNTFIRKLTDRTHENLCLVVDGGGTVLYAGFQSSILKEGDRIICSSAISSMGTGLAETIGSAMSGRFQRLLCVIGDGSFLMNVQDLQTIRQNDINVIIGVVNNNGYLAIRHTQKEFLGGRYFGTHPDWKLEMPPIRKIAEAFNIPYMLLDKERDTDAVVEKLFSKTGPVICEVVVDEDQEALFKQGYRANSDGTFSLQPLMEMAPFMPELNKSHGKVGGLTS